MLDSFLEGDAEKEVARKLGISPHTVHVYAKQLYRRFGVNSRSELLSQCLTGSAARDHAGEGSGAGEAIGRLARALAALARSRVLEDAAAAQCVEAGRALGEARSRLTRARAARAEAECECGRLCAAAQRLLDGGATAGSCDDDGGTTPPPPGDVR